MVPPVGFSRRGRRRGAGGAPCVALRASRHRLVALGTHTHTTPREHPSVHDIDRLLADHGHLVRPVPDERWRRLRRHGRQGDPEVCGHQDVCAGREGTPRRQGARSQEVRPGQEVDSQEDDARQEDSSRRQVDAGQEGSGREVPRCQEGTGDQEALSCTDGACQERPAGQEGTGCQEGRADRHVPGARVCRRATHEVPRREEGRTRQEGRVGGRVRHRGRVTPVQQRRATVASGLTDSTARSARR